MTKRFLIHSLIVIIDLLFLFWFLSSINLLLLFLVENKSYFLLFIIFLNAIEILKPDYWVVVSKYPSLYDYKMNTKEVYWLSDFLIDVFRSFKNNFKNFLISNIIVFSFIYFTFFLYKYFLFLFFIILIHYLQYFLLSVYFDFFLKKKTEFSEYLINIEYYNRYKIEWYWIIFFYLYIYPKSLSFLTVYYWFSNKLKRDDLKKNIIKNFYYRIIGISLITIKIIKFFYELTNDVILEVNWAEKKKIVWFFIFFFHIKLNYKIRINEALTSFFNLIRNRRIIITKNLIYTNNPEFAILKFLLHSEYKATRGGKFLAYFNSKEHQHLTHATDISEKGATYGSTLTHAKFIPIAPYYTDEKIKMETSLVNKKQNQFAVVGFVDNKILKHGQIHSYMQQYLNYEQRFLNEFSTFLEQLNVGYHNLTQERYFVYQNYKEKRLIYLQELESKNLIGKKSLYFIKEENIEKYLNAIAFLKKNYPQMTDAEAAVTITNSVDVMKTLEMHEKIEIFTDALIENDDIMLKEKDDFMHSIKFLKSSF